MEPREAEERALVTPDQIAESDPRSEIGSRQSGSRIADLEPWIVDRGSWIEDRGSWIADRGSRIEDRGSWVADRGSRIATNDGLNEVDHAHGRKWKKRSEDTWRLTLTYPEIRIGNIIGFGTFGW